MKINRLSFKQVVDRMAMFKTENIGVFIAKGRAGFAIDQDNPRCWHQFVATNSSKPAQEFMFTVSTDDAAVAETGTQELHFFCGTRTAWVKAGSGTLHSFPVCNMWPVEFALPLGMVREALAFDVEELRIMTGTGFVSLEDPEKPNHVVISFAGAQDWDGEHG